MPFMDQKKITIQQQFISFVGKRDFNTKKDKGAFVLYKCKGSFLASYDTYLATHVIPSCFGFEQMIM